MVCLYVQSIRFFLFIISYAPMDVTQSLALKLFCLMKPHASFLTEV